MRIENVAARFLGSVKELSLCALNTIGALNAPSLSTVTSTKPESYPATRCSNLVMKVRSILAWLGSWMPSFSMMKSAS